MLLDNKDFLAKLEQIFVETKDKGSVWLWFKQLPVWTGKHRGGQDKKDRQSLQIQQNLDSQQFTLLVRLKTKKHRFSTKVPPEESAYFQRLLHNVLLVHYPKNKT